MLLTTVSQSSLQGLLRERADEMDGIRLLGTLKHSIPTSQLRNVSENPKYGATYPLFDYRVDLTLRYPCITIELSNNLDDESDRSGANR